MTSGAAAAMPLARNAVTLSCCHCSRSARTAMAILVSKRIFTVPTVARPRAPVLNAGAPGRCDTGAAIMECGWRQRPFVRGLGSVLARGQRAGGGDVRPLQLACVPPAQPRELLIRRDRGRSP